MPETIQWRSMVNRKKPMFALTSLDRPQDADSTATNQLLASRHAICEQIY